MHLLWNSKHTVAILADVSYSKIISWIRGGTRICTQPAAFLAGYEWTVWEERRVVALTPWWFKGREKIGAVHTAFHLHQQELTPPQSRGRKPVLDPWERGLPATATVSQGMAMQREKEDSRRFGKSGRQPQFPGELPEQSSLHHPERASGSSEA